MKHRNIIKYAGFLGFTALVLIFSGCFLSAPTGKLVSPTIRTIGLPDASIVGSVTLKVTGPDMDPVEVSYFQLPSVINIAVPEGNDRKFELTVTPSAAYAATFKGTATAEVTSKSATVTLNMGISSTKIIVPDTYNNRLVQIDDMSDARWDTIAGVDINTVNNSNTNFSPWDVDFDQYGNFYVANNTTTFGGIYRFSSIKDTDPVNVLPALIVGMKVVAVDRINSILYGCDGTNTVSYVDIGGTASASFVVTGVNSILGMYVSNEGYLYIFGTDQNTGFLIEKYSPKGATKEDNFNDWTGTYGIPGDGVVNGGYLYVSSIDGNIYRFNPSDLPSPPVAVTGSFSAVRPSIFLATLNEDLTFVDSDWDGSTITTARLISINGNDNSKWTGFGIPGVASGEFKLFSGTFYDAAAPQ